MTERRLPDPEDDRDRKILGDIATVGWSVIGIEEEAGNPGYSFSVGIYHTLSQPELVIMGLAPRTAQQLINGLGLRMKAGERFAAGERANGVVAGYPVAFVGVDRGHYREYFGYAGWLYRGPEFPMLQCVWPDRKGLFPWEPGYDDRFFQPQRILGPAEGFPHGWPFPDAPNTITFTTRQVAREGRPVIHVYHDGEDGTWQFHGPDDFAEEDGLIVGLGEVLKLDPTLARLGNLPRGWRAFRDGPDRPWQRMKADEGRKRRGSPSPENL